MYRQYSGRGVRFFFVDANANEPVSEIVEYSKSVKFPFMAYKDTGNQLADRFGARATPEAYVIDAGGVLRYHGAVDDSQNEARVKVKAVAEALDAVIAGRPVDRPELKAFGCTIKRVRRTS
jgi:hypothetical protein